MKPFLDPDLFEMIHGLVKDKKVWEITEQDVSTAEKTMKDYALKRSKNKV